jgi:prevent-host-death family protein
MVPLTSAEAQNRFGHMLETAQQEIVQITRHGRPAAFVVSAREMEVLLDLDRRRKSALASYEAWRRQAAPATAPDAASPPPMRSTRWCTNYGEARAAGNRCG